MHYDVPIWNCAFFASVFVPNTPLYLCVDVFGKYTKCIDPEICDLFMSLKWISRQRPPADHLYILIICLAPSKNTAVKSKRIQCDSKPYSLPLKFVAIKQKHGLFENFISSPRKYWDKVRILLLQSNFGFQRLKCSGHWKVFPRVTAHHSRSTLM